jgi:hypothetical protein
MIGIGRRPEPGHCRSLGEYTRLVKSDSSIEYRQNGSTTEQVHDVKLRGIRDEEMEISVQKVVVKEISNKRGRGKGLDNGLYRPIRQVMAG